ncbi:alpha-ribazole phosphatase [Pseudoflavitalea sp. X16]|uniref:alpha-ribazole phosphatase n=1 Tax=Paraflavitalea devenefica TaxID=2716334 RepID=UPI00141E3DA8|nr:alpha-ribazole phosphatase [Paraflavitalea devenefica]NII23966.1 alpha-ribazole phosphatase [Paraflavitalea devenefica]
MSIYVIRHTTPLIEKGICYGQADIDVTEQFEEEAGIIRQYLPPDLQQVYSSPLQRCRKLAAHLFPEHRIQLDHDLKEINCGEWELLHWDDIPREVIDPWMSDYVNVCIPGGESYVHLYERVTRCFDTVAATGQEAAIVTHGGVIRSILAHITGTSLLNSFAAFSLHYGCVVKIDRQENGLVYEMLSNISTGKEQHKPSYK